MISRKSLLYRHSGWLCGSFQGIPGVKSILIEQTDIIADTLREDDRLILEKGLTINSEEEFLNIREGLTK